MLCWFKNKGFKRLLSKVYHSNSEHLKPYKPICISLRVTTPVNAERYQKNHPNLKNILPKPNICPGRCGWSVITYGACDCRGMVPMITPTAILKEKDDPDTSTTNWSTRIIIVVCKFYFQISWDNLAVNVLVNPVY